MNETNNKFYLIIGIIFIIVAIIIAIGIWFFLSRKDDQANDRIIPHEQTVKDPTVNSGSDLGIPQKEAEENRGYKLSVLATSLPYDGQNFSLYYDFDTDEYTLYVNPASQQEGNDEFNAYLKQNGIEATWITNLKRISQKP